jgi:hypothetical protein
MIGTCYEGECKIVNHEISYFWESETAKKVLALGTVTSATYSRMRKQLFFE